MRIKNCKWEWLDSPTFRYCTGTDVDYYQYGNMTISNCPQKHKRGTSAFISVFIIWYGVCIWSHTPLRQKCRSWYKGRPNIAFKQSLLLFVPFYPTTFQCQSESAERDRVNTSRRKIRTRSGLVGCLEVFMTQSCEIFVSRFKMENFY